MQIPNDVLDDTERELQFWRRGVVSVGGISRDGQIWTKSYPCTCPMCLALARLHAEREDK